MATTGALLVVPVPEVDAALVDYTSLQIEAATSYAGTYTLIDTETLVSGTTSYAYQYTSAVAGGFWRWRYYNATGPVASVYSEPMPFTAAPTTSRQTLRQQAAERLGLYLHANNSFTFPNPSFTTTGVGSTTTVVCTSFIQSSLSEDGTGTTSKEFDGWYLYLSSGAASGEESQVGWGAAAGKLAVGSGTFTVAPAYSAASGSGTTVEGYRLISAARWNRFLDDARLDLWYPADAYVAGIASQSEYALPYWIERDEQVLRMDARYGSTIRQHSLAYGSDFTIEMAEGGGCVLRVAGSLPANGVYVIRAMRHPAPFTSDTAAVPMAEQYQRLWWLTAAMRATQYLAQTPDRVVENTKQWQEKFVELVKEVQGLQREIGSWRTQRSARRTPMAYVSGWRGGGPVGATSRYY